MSRSTAPARLHQELTWVIPVKVEELKAGLRTWMYIEQCREAFQSCVDNKQASHFGISRLPPEMVDAIIEQLYLDVHDQFSRDWAMRYLCSSHPNDVQTIGTVWRFTASLTAWEKNACEAALIRFGDTICQSCRAVRSAALTDASTTQSGKDKSGMEPPLLYCEACTACQRLGFHSHAPPEAPLLDALDDHIHEYLHPFMLDNNPWDKHPETKVLQDYMWEESRWSWYQGVADYMREWNGVVLEDQLFTETETTVLREQFQLRLWIQNEGDDYDLPGPQSTTALLCPADASLFDERWAPTDLASSNEARLLSMRTASLVIPAALTLAQEEAFKTALKDLRLTPCAHLLREDCSEADAQSSAVRWPQIAALSKVYQPAASK